MDIRITATNVILKPITKTRITNKYLNLGSKTGDAKGASIDVREESTKSPDDRFLVKVELDLGIKKIYGETRGRTVLAAVDKSIDILAAQALKASGKNKKGAKKMGSVTRGTTIVCEKPIKLKKKVIVPSILEEEDAVAQSRINSLPFFIFIDKNSKELKIIEESTQEIFAIKIP
ncbi:MAG: hypothetical protein FWF37_05045 [Chloroflexi bacterium]|nr:hypothetical protein [Chloroflexota bacterium]